MSETKLRPCPFCGGEAHLIKALLGVANHVSCDICNARTEMYETEADAVEAWNTRAERTCHEKWLAYLTVGCSECGDEWREDIAYNYCPNCGAKVVEG